MNNSNFSKHLPSRLTLAMALGFSALTAQAELLGTLKGATATPSVIELGQPIAIKVIGDMNGGKGCEIFAGLNTTPDSISANTVKSIGTITNFGETLPQTVTIVGKEPGNYKLWVYAGASNSDKACSGSVQVPVTVVAPSKGSKNVSSNQANAGQAIPGNGGSAGGAGNQAPGGADNSGKAPQVTKDAPAKSNLGSIQVVPLGNNPNTPAPSGNDGTTKNNPSSGQTPPGSGGSSGGAGNQAPGGPDNSGKVPPNSGKNSLPGGSAPPAGAQTTQQADKLLVSKIANLKIDKSSINDNEKNWVSVSGEGNCKVQLYIKPPSDSGYLPAGGYNINFADYGNSTYPMTISPPQGQSVFSPGLWNIKAESACPGAAGKVLSFNVEAANAVTSVTLEKTTISASDRLIARMIGKGKACGVQFYGQKVGSGNWESANGIGPDFSKSGSENWEIGQLLKTVGKWNYKADVKCPGSPEYTVQLPQVTVTPPVAFNKPLVIGK